MIKITKQTLVFDAGNPGDPDYLNIIMDLAFGANSSSAHTVVLHGTKKIHTSDTIVDASGSATLAFSSGANAFVILFSKGNVTPDQVQISLNGTQLFVGGF